MLKCPRCGCTHFEGMDLSRPFQCPIPGCGAVIDPGKTRVTADVMLPEGFRVAWRTNAAFAKPSQVRTLRFSAVDGGWAVTGGSAETVTVPAMYQGQPVVEIAPGAFRHNETLRTLTIRGHMERIGQEAFASCLALNRVSLDETDAVEAGAFRNCLNLRSVQGKQPVSLAPDAFAGCAVVPAWKEGT